MRRGRRRDFNTMVGRRIRAAREEKGMKQRELARIMGFKDRQTLSSIENGERKVTSNELILLISVLGKNLEYFTDPFLLIGEGSFSWRAKTEPEQLDIFEERARSWIALYRTLGRELGEPINPLVYKLWLHERSSYEDAWDAAEQIQKMWDLGDKPARVLPHIVEEKLEVLVLHVDVGEDLSISGAACYMPEFSTILINRRDPDGRRAFDFAHELFHVLTWHSMPPERMDEEKTKKRIEQLADNFAASLLMPGGTIESLFKNREDKEIHEWINMTANDLGVTAKALHFRLINMNLISSKEKRNIDENKLTWNGRKPDIHNLPPLFSRKFMGRIKKGIDRAFLSEKKVAKLLGVSLEALRSLMRIYDLPDSTSGMSDSDARSR